LAFFVPWWLYFVEDIRKIRNKTIGWYILGGGLGAIIFMTYYYWFFLGGLSILLRLMAKKITGWVDYWPSSSIKNQVAILGITAAFSSVYWGPWLYSMFSIGAQTSQSSWFHAGYLSYQIPFFTFTVSGTLCLLGLVYLVLKRQKNIMAFYALLMISALCMITLDRFANFFQFSIQTRKLNEMILAICLVPAAFALVAFYGLVRRRASRFRPVLLTLATLILIYHGNGASNVLDNNMYKVGINSRFPADSHKVIESVDYKGKVFLTQDYINAVFYPFYMFICIGESASHPAALYKDRIDFLKFVGKIDDPCQVAYLLQRNRFDTVNYFYLPMDAKRGIAYLDIYPYQFPVKNNEKLTLEFPFKTTIESKYFIKRHDRGLYEITMPGENLLQTFNPVIAAIDSGYILSKYSFLRKTAGFLAKSQADSLRVKLRAIEDSLHITYREKPLLIFDKRIRLIDLNIFRSSDSLNQLILFLQIGEDSSHNLRPFVHAYPQEKGKDFINLDFSKPINFKSARIGEYLKVSKAIDLPFGTYKFHIGLLDSNGVRLSETYWSEAIRIQ
jgi:hypothetical protein